MVVSQFNRCSYCQSVHTVLGGMNGFSENQILEIRKGTASFDTKLNALAKFTLLVTKNKDQVNDKAKEEFF